MLPGWGLDSMRRWILGVEIVFSALTLVLVFSVLTPISFTIRTPSVWIVYLVPGSLGLAAILGAGIDSFGMISIREGVGLEGRSRWVVFGTLALSCVIGILAIGTLFFVLQTFLIVTVVDTGGGVLFGPVLFLSTGSLLAVVILVRTVGCRLILARHMAVT